MDSPALLNLDRAGPTRDEPIGVADARRYAIATASRSTENFHVLSVLVPRRIREDVASVYAYCRHADDLADESGNPARAAAGLAWWREELAACFAGRPRHAVFVALRRTIERHHLPREPFEHLLDAFDRDQMQNRYDTWDDLLHYCRRSANPVGRLYLIICGYRDEQRAALADQTCTALQLVNFWQDVRRDALDRGRVYIPRDVAAAHGLDVEALADAIRRGGDLRVVNNACCETIRDLVNLTRVFFNDGRALLPMLDADVRPAIRLFGLGGEAVLQKIVRAGYATHAARPRLGTLAKALLFARAAAGCVLAGR